VLGDHRRQPQVGTIVGTRASRLCIGHATQCRCSQRRRTANRRCCCAVGTELVQCSSPPSQIAAAPSAAPASVDGTAAALLTRTTPLRPPQRLPAGP
jgi:hypothetical protein